MTVRTKDFERHRSLLFSIAYRMLGSIAEAEDVVQEAYLRWREVPEGEVHSPKSYLSAVVTRLSIDRLRSARREEYIGPWLPEPLISDRAEELVAHDELDESLSMAFLVLLESLNPVERAVFLLREVFDYDYEEISSIVRKSEANCRQIARRARQSVAARRPRFERSLEKEKMLTERFVEACMSGDMEGLLELLSEDVTLWSDGGGKVQAARKPVRGAEKVAGFMLRLAQFGAMQGATYQLTTINGQPGMVAFLNGTPYTALALDFVEDKIAGIAVVVNPEKLTGLGGRQSVGGSP